jgi:hypothetical protein
MAIVNETALVYCENQFGLVDGKTASGLVRHSETYTVVGVIDSSLAGKDAGEELGEKKNGIPIFANLEDALGKLSTVPDCYIYGKAPLETYISAKERGSSWRQWKKEWTSLTVFISFFLMIGSLSMWLPATMSELRTSENLRN